jgi:hypothetical protein
MNTISTGKKEKKSGCGGLQSPFQFTFSNGTNPLNKT